MSTSKRPPLPPPPLAPAAVAKPQLERVRPVRWGLRSKLFIAFALVMLGYSGASNGYLLRHFFDDKARYVLFSLHQGAESLCVKLAPLVASGRAEPELKNEFVRELGQIDYAASYVFRSPEGRVLHATDDTMVPAALWALSRERSQSGKLSNFTFQHNAEGRTSDRYFVSGCRIGEASDTWLVLVVNATQALSPTRTLLAQITALFVGLLTVGFAVFWLLAKSLTRPLGQLTLLADNLGAGNYRTEVDVSNNDELGALADSFTILSQRLEQRDAELEKTTAIANQDFLTGLWNRRHMDRRTQEHYLQCKRYGRDLSIIYMDADHFKRINDTYGHAAGDEVLKDFARIFLREMRATDFVARVGGEEFCAVLPETDLDGALVAAAKLRDAIKAHTFLPQHGGVKMSASMGVESLNNGVYRNADELIAAADKYAYKSKTGGRDRISSARG